MKNALWFSVFTVALALTTSACCGGDSGSTSGSTGIEGSGSTTTQGGEKTVSTTPSSESGDPAPQKNTITLAELDNLKIDVAPGTEPTKMGSDLMILSMQESLMVGVASSSGPDTLEKAKREATEMFSGTNISEETLEDGWALTFENTGSLGKNYHVNIRRTIGGKAYYCHTMVANKVLSEGALRACKSLRQ